MNNLSRKIYFSLLFIFLVIATKVNAQDSNYASGAKYVIEEIIVTGNASFNKQTIITFTGLRKGQEILIPGEKTSNAIKKLWSSNLFSDVNMFVSKVDGKSVYLEIEVKELASLTILNIQVCFQIIRSIF